MTLASRRGIPCARESSDARMPLLWGSRSYVISVMSRGGGGKGEMLFNFYFYLRESILGRSVLLGNISDKGAVALVICAKTSCAKTSCAKTRGTN